LKKYLIQFKPFLIFIGTFFAAYIVLTLAYKFYLNCFEANEVDGITTAVSRNVEQLMHIFNYDTKVQKSQSNAWFNIIFNQKPLARIIEGCNAVSVIILFISFIIAFSGKFKTTLLFILFGICSVYVLNVVRIALLTVLLFHFPEQRHFLHGVFFPLVIYGYIFILWIFWVNKFSKYAK